MKATIDKKTRTQEDNGNRQQAGGQAPFACLLQSRTFVLTFVSTLSRRK